MTEATTVVKFCTRGPYKVNCLELTTYPPVGMVGSCDLLKFSGISNNISNGARHRDSFNGKLIGNRMAYQIPLVL